MKAFIAAVLIATPVQAYAADLVFPLTMEVVGSKSASEAVSIPKGSSIKAFVGGKEYASGSFVENDMFYVSITGTNEDSLKKVTFTAKVDGADRSLSVPDDFTFGGAFPLPTRQTVAYTVDVAPVSVGGSQQGSTTQQPSSDSKTCPASLPKCDVDGDGKFTQNDINLAKRRLGGKDAVDINGDGRANTADIIMSIKQITHPDPVVAATK